MSFIRTTPVLALGASLFLGACSLTEHTTGLSIDGRLTPCPDAPRCVSSQARDTDKQIDAFRLRPGVEQPWPRAVEVVRAMERTTVVKHNDQYLHAEVVSPWRFYTDDLELLYRPSTGVIHVRSSARIGYYDFNVNRERVQKLRVQLNRAGLLR